MTPIFLARPLVDRMTPTPVNPPGHKGLGDRNRNCRFARLPKCLGVIVVLMCGCDNSSTSNPAVKSEIQPKPRTTLIQFEEVTGSSGITFSYRNGDEAEEATILESLGGGIALFDLDADGKLDLFCPGGGHFSEKKADGQRDVLGWPHAIFRNEGDWKFTDVTVLSGPTVTPFYSHGAIADDFDNDGFCDVLITGYGGVLLLHNQGDGTLNEVAQTSGITTTSWSCAAGWGDFNNDGVLDLYVANYLNWSFDHHPFCPVSPSKPDVREICPPREFQGLPDVLYLGNGDGTFRDASRESGLRIDGKGLGVVVADFDLDGDVDVYVGNDMDPNFQYRNSGNAKFEEIGQISGTAFDSANTPEGSMGVDVGDFDLDGLPDLCSSNIAIGSLSLYRNDGNGQFHHASREFGVSSKNVMTVGWGIAMCDFDHDGDEDLFVSDGSMLRFAEHNLPLHLSPLLFENDHGKQLHNVAPMAGQYCLTSHPGRGSAAGDIDNDGDVDLAISRQNQPVALLSNTARTSNHWLSLRLIGRASPRNPIGAIVKIRTSQGTRMQQVKGGSSYASTNDSRLNFGLGTDPSAVIEIAWPSGRVQVVKSVACDQHWVVLEGDEPTLIHK